MAKMSLSGYAKYRKVRGLIGGTLTAVQAAVRDGRIDQDEDGEVDSDAADKQWGQRTNLSMGARIHAKHQGKVLSEVGGDSGGGVGGWIKTAEALEDESKASAADRPSKPTRWFERTQEAITPLVVEEGNGGSRGGSNDNGNGSRPHSDDGDLHPLVLKIQADYRLKLAKAEEAELKNAERKGLLLSAAVVKEQNVRQAKAIRDHMLSFASRRSGDIAAELGVRERLTYEVLDKAVRAHLAEISKELEVAE